MRVAVSGVNGFVGVHLAAELVAHDHQVWGVSKGPMTPDLVELVEHYVDVDLTQSWPEDVVETVDAVVHLAGLSAVGPSFADPQSYVQVNSSTVTTLCEALLAMRRSPRIVVVSSGALYAPGVDVDESFPTQASSPYAVSKILVETQCSYYRNRGLDILVMRPFNHIGPGQQTGFLLPDLIDGISRGALTVGDLSTRRDYTDVRDVARAYRLAIEAEQLDVALFNVCSGSSTSGQELLELVVAELEIAMPETQVDFSRIRSADAPEICGSNALIGTRLGWSPRIALATTVRDTVAAQQPASPGGALSGEADRH